jgi:hypothetical protein
MKQKPQLTGSQKLTDVKRNENATEGKFKTYRHSKETKVQPREVQNFIESQVSAPLAE